MTLEQTRSVGEKYSHPVLPPTTLERTRSVGETYSHSVLPDVDHMFKMIRRNSLLSKADLSFQNASMKCIMSAADGMIDQLNQLMMMSFVVLSETKMISGGTACERALDCFMLCRTHLKDLF